MNFFSEIEKIIPRERIIVGESMDKYTTFKIGGRAEVIVEPANSGEICALVELFNSLGTSYLVLGNGSNILASDSGIDIPVIRIGKNMSGISLFDSTVTAQAGAALSAVANFAMENSLTGLEFAAGIPGTLGGGVIMNAGAYGGELKNVVEAVSFVGPDGKEYVASGDEMEFGYRTSALQDGGCIVTAVSLALRPGKKADIAEKMKELNRRRREKQPLEYPSAGSTFKRPAGHYAGTLIQEAGLKGYAVGGAAVSEKHTGFIINKGGATGADVLAVMDHVIKTVYDKSGVVLEPEVKIWGESK